MSKVSKLLKTPNIFFRDFFDKKLQKKVDRATDQPDNKSDLNIEKKFPPESKLAREASPITVVKPKTEAKVKVKPMPNKKIKSQSEYLAELTEFTRNFDVNTLKYDNEYLWPYLRSHLWVQLYLLGFGKDASRLIPHRLQLGTKDNIKNYVRGLIKNKVGALEIDELEEDVNGIDFLFLTVLNAAEQVELEDGSIYYHITDPIYEEAMQLGKAKKIELIKVNSPAIEKCANYKHQPTFLLPPKIRRVGYSDSVSVDKHFFDVAKRMLPSLEFTEQSIMNTIDWELHTRDYCLDILKKIKPKILFFNGFHYHAPWISAANQLGIITVDVQHGIQVGWNPLYNNWYELPKEEGYQAIPDYFWVWGEKEFNSIKKVFASSKHQPIIGGFPWLSRQLDYMPPLKDSVKAELEKYNKIFLVILQNQKEVPVEYLDIIESSGDGVAWIIRHHPKGNKFKKSDFSKDGLENIYISEYFDKISLARLFEVVDVCISAGSTVALEADHFGVRNIIFTEEGKNNYIEEIQNGDFDFASNADEFNQKISKIDFSFMRKGNGHGLDINVQNTLNVFLTKFKRGN